MNKVVVVVVTVVALFLTVNAFVLDALGQANTGHDKLNGRVADALWAGQSGCVQRRIDVSIGDLVEGDLGATPPPGHVKLVRASVSDFDICANQVLLVAGGSSPLPSDADIDPALATASVHATVELSCDPLFSPPCSPFSIDIDLTWTGIGAIFRGAPIRGHRVAVCPDFSVETSHLAIAFRLATVTGDVSSGGTSLITGFRSIAYVVENHGGSVIILPGDNGPFHPCH